MKEGWALPNTPLSMRRRYVAFHVAYCTSTSNLAWVRFYHMLLTLSLIYRNKPTNRLVGWFLNLSWRRYGNGKSSFVNLLPMPPVSKVEGHIYVSLHDIIADFLLHSDSDLNIIKATDPKFKVVPSLVNSRCAVKKKRDYEQAMAAKLPVIHIGIVEWSDDFEGNSSIKSDRSSMWAKTVTIICNRRQPTPNSTYIVGLAEKSDDHEPVEALFAKSLKDLCDPQDPVKFYFGSDQQTRHVAVHLLASLADQPERRGANHLRGGNSNILRRWGWRVSVEGLLTVAPSCSKCSDRVNLNIANRHGVEGTGPIRCEDCWNWGNNDNDLPSNTCKQRYFPFPDGFPDSAKKSTGCPSKGMLIKRIEYTELQQAVDTAFENIAEGRWDTKGGRTYLSTMGIDEQYGNRVIRNAENAADLRDAERLQHQLPEDYKSVLQAYKAQPDDYKPPPYPSLWTRGQTLRQHVDCPMHLLFLGVVKKILTIQMDWARARLVQKQFVELATKALEDVADVQLPWCVVLPINVGGFGGWVSENYVGLSRIFDWYSTFFLKINIDETPDEADPEEMPDATVNGWNRTVCRTWYKVHQVPPAERQTKLLQMRDHIRHFIETGQYSARRVEMPTRRLLLLLTRLTSILVSNVMAPEAARNVASIRWMVATYLTTCRHYDTLWRTSQNIDPKKKPFWVSCFNFCSLMNLCDMIYDYGGMQHLWEGGYQGEKILTQIKPLVVRGSSRGFQEGVVNKFQMNKILKRFLTRLDGTKTGPSTHPFGKVYHCADEIRAAMIAKKPIVVVWFKGGPVGCVVRGQRCDKASTLSIMPLKVTLGPGWWSLNDLVYWKWYCSIYDHLIDMPSSTTFKETLFLPYLFDNVDGPRDYQEEPFADGGESVVRQWGKELVAEPQDLQEHGHGRRYHVIDSDWHSLSGKFTFETMGISTDLQDRMSQALGANLD